MKLSPKANKAVCLAMIGVALLGIVATVGKYIAEGDVFELVLSTTLFTMMAILGGLSFWRPRSGQSKEEK